MSIEAGEEREGAPFGGASSDANPDPERNDDSRPEAGAEQIADRPEDALAEEALPDEALPDEAGPDEAAPAAPGEPWRIPGVDRLEEGHGRALFLERSDGGPILEVILCRVDGRLYALDSECPHAGGRIQGGPLVEGRYARCPLHWFDFDPADGRCVNVDCEPASTLRIEEHDGVAVLWAMED